MIIWIRNRRGWILGLFIALIIVFAGGFVIGGVGSGNNYSLGDILDQNGNGASTTAQSADITALRAKVKANPKDAASWSLLADAYLASSTDGKEAAKALTTYLDLKPGDLSAMQRLATSYLSAYQYETQLGQAYTSQAGSLPGLTDSTFDSGTLSSLTTDALQSAQAAQSQILAACRVRASRAIRSTRSSRATRNP